MRAAGGNWRTLRKYAEKIWLIPTDHFDPARSQNEALRRPLKPLEEILVRESGYSRSHLKRRLFDQGLKQRVCEMCGQGEIWHGRRMALILDHVNGVANDNRIENLRIVCPNCAATLDTHCGRQNRLEVVPRNCRHCGREFLPQYPSHRYCSRHCGVRASGYGSPKPELRRARRPPYSHLLSEVQAIGYSATGRRYGVSDNAIRKWLHQYEREEAGDRDGAKIAHSG